MKIHHHGTNGSVPHGKPKPRQSPTAASARAHKPKGSYDVRELKTTHEHKHYPKVKGHIHHD